MNNFKTTAMNNLKTATGTTPESLPRSGHVNEVCKEWLVREDGALAYKLQSQEINDFYKGNRYRNAVVREDFPTALHEQIKESENAQRQKDAYRKRLGELEEHDKRVAKEIADKLERDLQEQQQKELQESETIAQQMQEIYVNLPPVPPPSSRDKNRPPPRPAKASTQQHEAGNSNARYHNHSQQHFESQPQLQYPLQLQQQHFLNNDNYVGLTLLPHSVELPATSSRQQQQQQQPISQNHNHPAFVVSDEANNLHHHHHHQRYHHHHHHHQHQLSNSSTNSATSSSSPTASSSSATAAAAAAVAVAAAARRNVFDFPPSSPQYHMQHTSSSQQQQHYAQSTTTASASTSTSTPTPTPTSNTTAQHNSSLSHGIGNMPESSVDELVDYSDVADSIRHYDISSSTSSSSATNTTTITTANNDLAMPCSSKLRSASHENLLRTEQKFQKLSPEKYDQLIGNDLLQANGPGAAAAERHMQQHADDIELYVDPCDYASLREIGLPMAEIKEMSKKLKQEQKDELLARRLQALESKDSVHQEERDRMLAIEAQDKELARMLQEREKAKAKRAKEKARLRKSQQQKEATSSGSLCGTTICGPLMPLPQDCMSSITSANKHSTAAKNQHTNHIREDEVGIDVEAYSNPIDVINNSLRMQNGTLTNGSLGRESIGSGTHRQPNTVHREDDIYTLPVDSCRPGQARPVSLHAAAETVQQLQTNAMSRSEHYGTETLESHNSHDIMPHMKYSKSGNFDQNSSPTPPYMPIQGTRRSNSSEDRKKKSKDNKCTHQ